jgi:hypothetical protein
MTLREAERRQRQREESRRTSDVLRRALLRDARGNASTPLGAALDRIAELLEAGR